MADAMVVVEGTHLMAVMMAMAVTDRDGDGGTGGGGAQQGEGKNRGNKGFHGYLQNG